MRNRIRREGGIALCEMLKVNLHIESLNLQFNKVPPSVRKEIEKASCTCGDVTGVFLQHRCPLSNYRFLLAGVGDVWAYCMETAVQRKTYDRQRSSQTAEARPHQRRTYSDQLPVGVGRTACLVSIFLKYCI